MILAKLLRSKMLQPQGRDQNRTGIVGHLSRCRIDEKTAGEFAKRPLQGIKWPELVGGWSVHAILF